MARNVFLAFSLDWYSSEQRPLSAAYHVSSVVSNRSPAVIGYQRTPFLARCADLEFGLQNRIVIFERRCQRSQTWALIAVIFGSREFRSSSTVHRT